jgi:hypothetical protein
MTFFLVTPNEKYSDLPRHPVELDTPDDCMVCHIDDGDPLACDKVSVHFATLLFPLCSYFMHSAIKLITTRVSPLPWPPSQMANGSARNACAVPARLSATRQHT